MRRIGEKQRKGLSTVVAGVFMIIIMSSAIGLTAWTMQQQDRVTDEILVKTNEKLSRLSEELDISDVRITNNKFNITLVNEGGSAARAKVVYIVNETAVPKQQYRYDIDYLVDGRTEVKNVGQALAFTARNTTSYSIRVITESGSAASAEYLAAASTPIPMSLYVIPPTITTGENVTILYAVTNNITTSNSPLTISPKITSSISCGGSVCTLTKITSAPSQVVIQKGATALVKEVYRADGPPSTIMTFNASYTGAKGGNYIIDRGTIIVVTLSQSLITSIATKPDMYLILPGPFGKSTQQGLWGAVVVNPTTSTMKVSRVLMTAFTGSHTGTTQVVQSGCATTAISPSTASEWSCPHDNQIQWKRLGTPLTLNPGDIYTFLVRAEPKGLPANEEEPGATITSTVYTDIGVFTKTGYTVGMHSLSEPLGNVYMTDSTDQGTSGALNNAKMFGHRSNIAPATNTTFYVTMADLDTDVNTYINAGGRLIINVPPGFSNVTITFPSVFTPITKTVRADGITQIIGVTTGNTGDSASGEAKTIAFAAVTPSPATDTTYLMFAFIDGVTNSNPQFSAGAIAEMAIEIDVP
jgi:hypothetical protein